MSKKVVTCFTDGACSGNPGPGGWGVILEYQGVRKEFTPKDSELHELAKTTNNRAELLGMIAALKLLKEPCIVHAHTDSNYVIQGFASIERWLAKKNLKNRDLWLQAKELLNSGHEVVVHKVEGHAGIELNERCDELARQATRRAAACVS